MKLAGCILALSALFVIAGASSKYATAEEDFEGIDIALAQKEDANVNADANLASQEADDSAEEGKENTHLNEILEEALSKYELSGRRCQEKHGLGQQAQDIHLPRECPCTWCTECANGLIYKHPTERYRMICYSIKEATQDDIATLLGASPSSSSKGDIEVDPFVALSGKKSGARLSTPQAPPACDGTLYLLKAQQDSFANKKCWKRLCLINCQKEGGVLVNYKQTLHCIKSTDTGLVDPELGKLTCIKWIR